MKCRRWKKEVTCYQLARCLRPTRCKCSLQRSNGGTLETNTALTPLLIMAPITKTVISEAESTVVSHSAVDNNYSYMGSLCRLMKCVPPEWAQPREFDS